MRDEKKQNKPLVEDVVRELQDHKTIDRRVDLIEINNQGDEFREMREG